ncbi:hypothetical protein ABF224_002792 [Yersinia ruckeri]
MDDLSGAVREEGEKPKEEDDAGDNVQRGRFRPLKPCGIQGKKHDRNTQYF